MIRHAAWAGVFALVLLCLGFLLAAPAYGYARYQVINQTATWLANGRQVHIRCLTVEEAAEDYYIAIVGAAAYVEGYLNQRGEWKPRRYAVFDHGLCEPLLALAAGDTSLYDDEDVAWSVLVLAHESGHLRGHAWSGDEALTERFALRHYRYTAMRLGASADRASDLLRHAVRIHRGMSEAYLAPGCRIPSVNADGLLVGCK